MPGPPNLVKELREARGLSQDELAKAVGCDESTISRIEGGKRGGRDLLKLKIARFFGKEVHEVWLYESMAVGESA